MKKLILSILILTSANVMAAEQVKYLKDTIMDKQNNYIRLLGGTSWELSYSSLALTVDEVIIVFHTFQDKQNNVQVSPVFYHDGEEIPARFISGDIVTEDGFLVTIIGQINDGAILETDDGHFLFIPEYDRYDTGWWLPPYRSLITSNGLYMWNLKKGKRIWVDRIQSK